MNDRLDDRNFLIYTCKNYYNPNIYDIQEFHEDLDRIKYIRRLFNRYLKKGDLQERLIVNHILVLCNCFGVEPTIRILFYKLEGYEEILKTFLEFLSLMPEKVPNIGPFGKDYFKNNIRSLDDITKRLENM